MAEQKAIMEFKNVHTGYKDHPVIKGVDFEVKPGEFVGLIGSNGTGKSTLLKATSGLLDINEGDILINGISTTDLSAKQRAQQVAVVPQTFLIDYDFTVRDIVRMGRNPYLKLNERESAEDLKKVEEAMKLTKTDQYADRLFNELSGGERQRVIIARAIAQDTDIILLDEPTSALDLHHQIEVMELIEDLNKQGITVLAVLHDLNLASRFCDRLIMLNHGKIIADGKPEEVMVENNLNKIYDMKMLIRNNSLFEKPEIVPIRVLKEKETKQPKKIHIICGGDQAGRLIEELDDKGYDLSIGVINEGTNDYVVAESLGLNMITQKPFMPVDDDLQSKNLKLMKEADIILIADVPFGEMNIKNLDGIEDLNKPVFVHEHAIASDFTGGKLKEKLDKIKDYEIVSDHDDFINILEGNVENI